jgi:hypothetical protein
MIKGESLISLDLELSPNMSFIKPIFGEAQVWQKISSTIKNMAMTSE